MSKNQTSQTRPKGQTVTLDSGVVVRLKEVSPYALDLALRLLPKPEVPVVYIEEKGRSEENPSDPAYRKALEEYEQKRNDLVIDTCLLFGVEVMWVPEGVPGPEDSAWTADLELLGFTVETDKRKRLLQWLKLIAIRSNKDLAVVKNGTMYGTPEAEVLKAMESFRSHTPRRADSEPRAEAHG